MEEKNVYIAVYLRSGRVIVAEGNEWYMGDGVLVLEPPGDGGPITVNWREVEFFRCLDRVEVGLAIQAATSEVDDMLKVNRPIPDPGQYL